MNNYIEHTLLKQDAKKSELIELFSQAREYNFLGVCVNPCFVKMAKEYLKDTNVKVVTVIGFPLGANTTETKVFETKNAVESGADEIDMVINVSMVKDKETDYIVEEISQIKNACQGKNLKVIIHMIF